LKRLNQSNKRKGPRNIETFSQKGIFLLNVLAETKIICYENKILVLVSPIY
jgi:hypothetical protein